VTLVSLLDSFGPLTEAVFVIGGFVVLSVVLGRVASALVHHDMLREHNDLAGFIFAVVGVTYAVLLGFIAIGVWERFAAAEDRTYDEASRLTAIYRDAGEFSGGASVRRDLRAYVENVVKVGWPAMRRGEVDRDTELQAERVAFAVETLVPKTPQAIDVHQQMLVALDASLADRDARLSEDAHGLNGLMWTVLLAGGFITIAFSYLFGFRHSWMQAAMIGTLALLIGLVIYLTMGLDFPFRGSITVPPDAFERALSDFALVDSAQTR
jgi:hypothetical protein